MSTEEYGNVRSITVAYVSWNTRNRKIAIFGKSLQYLQDGDLDYILSSPKRLLLAEKRALDHEL